MRKKLLLIMVCAAVVIGMIVSFRAVEDPPEEEFLEGEKLENGTYRYEDKFGTVIEADWDTAEPTMETPFDIEKNGSVVATIREENSEVASSANDDEVVSIAIPSQGWIRENGYPKNDNGETYGPDLPEMIDSDSAPTLVLVKNKEGKMGYVKRGELEGLDDMSLEEARDFKGQKRNIAMYLQDGITAIGYFEVGEDRDN